MTTLSSGREAAADSSARARGDRHPAERADAREGCGRSRRRRRVQPGPRPAPALQQGRPAREEGGPARRDESVLAETGIRMLRDKPVFTTPECLPARGVQAGRGRRRAEFRESGRAAALLRLQAENTRELHHFYDQLCPPCADLNFAQAHRDRRSARPGGAAHRRPGQDRLPGRAQAAARGRAAHRHHALSARLGGALRAGARLRGVGRSARDLRARPSPHAERRGVLPASARDAGAARLHRQQRLPDRAPPARLLRAHDGARDARPRRAAGATSARCWRVRGAARHRHAPGRRVRLDARRHDPRPSSRRSAAAGGAGRRRATSSRRAGSTRICSRSICATGTRGGCCSPKSRRSSCSRCSSSTPSRRSSSTRG